MAQKLEVSMLGYELNKDDQQILQLLESGELPIEQVVALSDVESSRALSSVTRLIAAGHLRLAIITYPWGVEFVLQPTDGITLYQPGNQNEDRQKNHARRSR